MINEVQLELFQEVSAKGQTVNTACLKCGNGSMVPHELLLSVVCCASCGTTYARVME